MSGSSSSWNAARCTRSRWELMGAGRKLADKLGVELAAAVLCGPGDADGRSSFGVPSPTAPTSSIIAPSPVLTITATKPIRGA